MKNLIIFLGLFLSINLLAQEQLEIQGDPTSQDTVAKIRVNYNGKLNVVGLSVYSDPSKPLSEYGLAGYFYGGWRGVLGRSENGTGVIGQSTNGPGVTGESTNEPGVTGISDNSYGVRGESTNHVGVYGLSGDDVGVSGFSTNGPGVLGESVTDYGVIGTSTDLYGVYGESTNSYGVYGRGDILADFWAHNGTYGNSSSRRWKHNVQNISNSLDKLSKIRGVTFDWDKEHGGKHAVGFIAEEIGEIIPEVVFYEENGIDAKGMDYSKMTPLLVEATNAMRREYLEKFDDQQSEIDALKQEMAELRTLLKAQVKNASED